MLSRDDVIRTLKSAGHNRYITEEELLQLSIADFYDLGCGTYIYDKDTGHYLISFPNGWLNKLHGDVEVYDEDGKPTYVNTLLFNPKENIVYGLPYEMLLEIRNKRLAERGKVMRSREVIENLIITTLVGHVNKHIGYKPDRVSPDKFTWGNSTDVDMYYRDHAHWVTSEELEQLEVYDLLSFGCVIVEIDNNLAKLKLPEYLRRISDDVKFIHVKLDDEEALLARTILQHTVKY